MIAVLIEPYTTHIRYSIIGWPTRTTSKSTYSSAFDAEHSSALCDSKTTQSFLRNRRLTISVMLTWPCLFIVKSGPQHFTMRAMFIGMSFCLSGGAVQVESLCRWWWGGRHQRLYQGLRNNFKSGWAKHTWLWTTFFT